MTYDQMFESFRRASESSLQMQQDMFKQMTQQLASTPLNAVDISAEWVQKAQKRWMESTTESLNRHRESIDAMYKSLIQLLEQAFRLSDAKTPDDYRRTTEELRHKVLETFKGYSETNLREFQTSAERWFDLLPKA